MNSFTRSSTSFAVPSISDLNGYTIRHDCFPTNSSYMPADQDEFGFDPPPQKTLYPKMVIYGPPEDSIDSPLGGSSGFERENDRKQQCPEQTYYMDKVISQSLTSNAVARYGEVTPTRTNSSGSVDSVSHSDKFFPISGSECCRKPKQAKRPEPTATTTSRRKRKNIRKAAANAKSTVEDSKRKVSLEKNRLAAAKCRVNKREKTEQLQRSCHDKAVYNKFLKNEFLRMKEEIQQLNVIILAHSDCEGCKSPEEIQQHLLELGTEYLTRQIPPKWSSLQWGASRI